jgi:hypothetical protein
MGDIPRSQLLRSWGNRIDAMALQQAAQFANPGSAKADALGEWLLLENEFLPLEPRTGAFTENFNCPPHNNHLVVTATFDAPPAGVGFSFLIEQQNQGDWSVMGGAEVLDVAEIMAAPNKDGSPRTGLQWRFTEQVVDTPGNGETTGSINRGGKLYHQYAMSPVQRVSFDSFTMSGQTRVPAELTYAIDILADVVELS